jgi:hypothetical protein
MGASSYGSYGNLFHLVSRLFCIAVTIQDWILAVNLLLSWDDQKTISAAEMEEFLSRVLEVFRLADLL